MEEWREIVEQGADKENEEEGGNAGSCEGYHGGGRRCPIWQDRAWFHVEVETEKKRTIEGHRSNGSRAVLVHAILGSIGSKPQTTRRISASSRDAVRV